MWSKCHAGGGDANQTEDVSLERVKSQHGTNENILRYCSNHSEPIVILSAASVPNTQHVCVDTKSGFKISKTDPLLSAIVR